MSDSSHGSRGPSLASALKDQKTRQVTQRFFTKAALMIVQARTKLPQSFLPESYDIQVERWFGITVDDTDVLKDDLSLWNSLGVTHNHAPPLFIEIYLDSAELPRNHTIVIQDERGRRWDACEALEVPSSSGSETKLRRKKNTRVVLERWKIQLVDDVDAMEQVVDEQLPAIYKKTLVMFRSMYTYARLLPAWGFGRRLAKQPASLNSLRPMYRISANDPTGQPSDTLRTSLYPSADPVTQHYAFDPIHTSAGKYQAEVIYRVNCDFKVADAETILSSRFSGMNVQDIRPSTIGATTQRVPQMRGGDAGSLPVDNTGMGAIMRQKATYGSLGTYHQAGPPVSSSPLSALRAAGEINAGSPPDSPPMKVPPDHRSSQSSKSSLKPADGAPTLPRRVSVSFQPFKAGSLASSPATGVILPPPSSRPGSGEGSVASGTAAHARSRSSLSTIPAASLKKLQGPSNDVAVGSPANSSPKAPPITRYSSSFGNRKARWSAGGGVSSSKTEDGNTSSDRASQASSNQPGSGLLNEGQGSTPASVDTDDHQIADFLNLIEKNKDLRSLNRTGNAHRDANSRRTRDEMNRFQQMRDSHGVLSESLSSSLYQTSDVPASSVRHPSSVPPLLADASGSTSSPPGKPVSPHTPHTPAVPSRLSANATVDEPESQSSEGEQSRHQASSSEQPWNTTSSAAAIDIPTSPQRFPALRRSSSAAHRQRVIGNDFGMRASTSAPLDLDERAGPDLTLEELFNQSDSPAGPPAASANRASPQRDSDSRRQSNYDASRRPSSGTTADRHPTRFRSRLSRTGAGGSGSNRGSNSSIGTGSAGASGSAGERGGGGGSTGRYSFSSRPPAPAIVDDDEPLVFTMSDMGGAGSRRSLESGGAGSGSGGTLDRGAGGSGSTESSPRKSGRRGSRRGAW